ncbi:hypothetical protein [Thiolapillus brandeum]|uniref:GTPase n=1 Tax=Thiolapillus brandeum TaxID=1076588 RepID=A0A7U6GII5_9GAMM|nr:hypothetical protein [Thiolapillus brandeum]BAO44247.1 conserved hypothetical protein [Thiolapillus brandeum]
MPNQPTLIFVYNADSGMFNTLADIGHKIFSPESYACSLCAITHGYFHERKEWRQFVEALPVPCRFMHRDEFYQSYPHSQEKLPAVFLLQEEILHCCVSAEQLETCDNINQLKQRIMDSCIKHPRQ